MLIDRNKVEVWLSACLPFSRCECWGSSGWTRRKRGRGRSNHWSWRLLRCLDRWELRSLLVYLHSYIGVSLRTCLPWCLSSSGLVRILKLNRLTRRMRWWIYALDLRVHVCWTLRWSGGSCPHCQQPWRSPSLASQGSDGRRSQESQSHRRNRCEEGFIFQ